MSQKKDAQTLRDAWDSLRPGYVFFVPCLDPAKNLERVLAAGYGYRQPTPIVTPGVHRGMTGLLCTRDWSKAPVVIEQRRIVPRAGSSAA